MSTYKRWLRPRLSVNATIASGFALGGWYSHRLDEKRQGQAELHAWEGEGGNPGPGDERGLFSLVPRERGRLNLRD
jgi:hypothetical protein